jgi:hypothetical protein
MCRQVDGDGNRAQSATVERLAGGCGEESQMTLPLIITQLVHTYGVPVSGVAVVNRKPVRLLLGANFKDVRLLDAFVASGHFIPQMVGEQFVVVKRVGALHRNWRKNVYL